MTVLPTRVSMSWQIEAEAGPIGNLTHLLTVPVRVRVAR